jgi:hypothetical protein
MACWYTAPGKSAAMPSTSQPRSPRFRRNAFHSAISIPRALSPATHTPAVSGATPSASNGRSSQG